MRKVHAKSSRGPGLATWMIRPADGWRHKTRGLVKNRMFLLLGLIGMAFAASLAINAWILLFFWPHPLLGIQSLFLVAGLAVTLTLPVLIYHHLITPLFHLRHWAQRARGGNLAARIPIPSTGEFAELAQDVNALTEQLQRLTREMRDEVSAQTERLEQKSHTLEVLYDVAASINTSRDLDDLLTRFLTSLKHALGAQAATARLVTPDGHMRLVANLGFEPDDQRCRQVLPLGKCMCGRVADGGDLSWKADIRQCGRVTSDCDTQEDEPAMITIPLQHRGKTLGVYSLFLHEWPEHLNEDMDNLLTSIGRHLGMAIEKARVDEEAQRLGIIEERTHLAHELHDSLAQTLATLRFRVRALDETAQDASAETRREIDQIKDVLNRANVELRALISHFRAPMEPQGFVAAVEKMVETLRRETGISVYLQKEWRPRKLPAEMETEVLRIVQEALCNIRKHAQAQHVRVLLRNDAEGECMVMVEDDGLGLQPAEQGAPGEHIGLSVMTERAARLDADFRIESEPGEGTRISLAFHYPKPRVVEFTSRNDPPAQVAR
ncbi:GAF sensor signal transduction histidine kinase [Thioalkalivibrio sulfidiphilus HL-EbGr7]|uniref:Sensor protein n=1 Tax=Thioalkalivibrio sulfidiphilus (strain HL-EbGR7) TaxID=396588 RepID=B8GUD0_THISH|nr:histidine kinase [Thioalkalivibrio sulfidiphilus]ACL73250.1 GAF sensor signal transduction histidine kinase [Thioalkalivibrio sulfidiphilus HL-EbGr7]